MNSDQWVRVLRPTSKEALGAYRRGKHICHVRVRKVRCGALRGTCVSLSHSLVTLLGGGVACAVPGNGDGHTLATTSVHDHTIESPETGLAQVTRFI